MKDLLSYLKPYRIQSFLAPFFKMAEALFDLCVPLVTADIIDNGIENSDKNYILVRCLVIVALAIAGLLCSVTAQYFSARVAVSFACDVRQVLFTRIMSFSERQADALGRSTLINRATDDITRLQNGVNMLLRLLLRSPFIVFGSVILAFTVDARVASVFVAAVVVLAFIVWIIMKTTVPMYRKIQEKTDKVVSLTRENLAGVRVIRAFNRQDSERSGIVAANADAADAAVRAGRVSSLTDPLTGMTVNLAIIAILYTGALRLDAGALSQGEVVALVSYMSQILVELIKLADLISQSSKAIACASRISTVLKIEPDMEYGTGNTVREGDAVTFDSVSFRYPGASDNSLSDISFSVKRGERIGIIGSTGSGKSTLVSLVERLYDATSGEIHLFGKPIGEFTQEALRDTVCAVPQTSSLFSGTIRSNLKWADADADDAKLNSALRTAQALDFVSERRDGLDSPVEQGGRNLSGGQRQRLNIARALVGVIGESDRILVLDDSSSALDYATDAALRSALLTDCAGVTVFTVSQRASSIMNCNLILVLEEGKLVGKGSHSELLETCQVYREIYTRSFPDGGNGGDGNE